MSLTIEEGYASFRPEGDVTLESMVEMVRGAIAYCRDQGIQRLVADVTKLFGFPPPTLTERYWFVQEWAEEAKGVVRVALIARPEYIDPQKFGVIVALNAGFNADIFTRESEALEWLLPPKPE